jgi:hypothetical protein
MGMNMRKEVREHGRSKRKEKMREQKIYWGEEKERKSIVYNSIII